MFVPLFFTLYTLLHVYFFIKLRSGFRLTTPISEGVLLFLLFMILAPVFVRVLEKNGYERIAAIYAYVGYTWMAFIFLFFCFSLLFEMLRILSAFFPNRWISRTQRWLFLLPSILAFSLVVYGFFEARNLKIERITILTDRLPQGLTTLRIVQISDLHLGLLVNEKELKKYIDKIGILNPHILVCTGDFVDSIVSNTENLADLFSSIQPPLGKYAVTGNHEYYAGIKSAREFLRRSGFKVLTNEALRIKNGITIFGVDDASSYLGLETEALKRLDGGDFVILLKHRPIVSEGSIGHFDIQLSGHTHGGQIFPFKFITRIFFRYVSGHEILGERSHLYVSKGTGTWGPPVRVFCPPEITVIEVVKKDP